MLKYQLVYFGKKIHLTEDRTDLSQVDPSKKFWSFDSKFYNANILFDGSGEEVFLQISPIPQTDTLIIVKNEFQKVFCKYALKQEFLKFSEHLSRISLQAVSYELKSVYLIDGFVSRKICKLNINKLILWKKNVS